MGFSAKAVFLSFALMGVSGVQAVETRSMSLDECVRMALENNRMRKISEYDVRIAEALLQQAKSAYWPTLSAGVTVGLIDEPMLFTYPASSFTTPPMTIPGLGTLPGQTVEIPKQSIELLDREVLMAGLNLQYPLYTGGLRKAINEQAAYGVAAAKEGFRRTELEVVRDVERAYYGAVLARNLDRIADDTLRRMEATLDLTKRLYEEGAGTVKKTDYLQNKTIVEMIRSVKNSLKSVRVNADTALVHLVGMDHGSRIEPSETELPEAYELPSMEGLLTLAMGANPDLGLVRAGIGAASAQVMEARSGYKPKFGLFAKYAHFENSLDTGIMDEQNRDFVGVGIAGQIPLFEGFRTQGQVLEANLKLEKLRHQEDLLMEGLALQIEQSHAALESACERKVSVGEGLTAARENRELNIRAYQEELVETADVIQAQFMEAFLDFSYQKTLYECVEARALLNFVAGTPAAQDLE